MERFGEEGLGEEIEIESLWSAHKIKILVLLTVLSIGGIWYVGFKGNEEMRVKVDCRQLEKQLVGAYRSQVPALMGAEPDAIVERNGALHLRYDCTKMKCQVWDSYYEKEARTLDIMIAPDTKRVVTCNYEHVEESRP